MSTMGSTSPDGWLPARIAAWPTGRCLRPRTCVQMNGADAQKKSSESGLMGVCEVFNRESNEPREVKLARSWWGPSLASARFCQLDNVDSKQVAWSKNI
jgi:hypothetical protein